jgi:prepilin-type N-terminal cleavage/methylation domain-containing protein
MPRQSPCRNPTNLAGRAFSLVELLTVIGILAIVMAIVLPAMNSARRTAKMADTRATLASLQQSCSTFNTDNRRDPGYFSPKDMGASANATAGFDSMSNIMLDLMGGVVSPSATGTSVITVGPGTTMGTTQVKVDLAGFGASHQSTTSGAVVKNYFVADSKKMVAQDPALGQRFGTGAGTGGAILPSLVDAFGQPILAWVQDNPNAQNFALDASPAVSSPSTDAQFYWNQNAGFLNSGVTKLGRIAESQAYASGGSLLASDNSAPNRLNTLAALLGNPAAPDPTTPTKPASPRGPIVFHSAGADGVFVGKRDRGGNSGVRTYTANKDDFNGALFDDQIMSAGH